DPAAHRQSAAREPGSGSARRHWNAVLARQTQHQRHLVARFGQHRGFGRKAAKPRFVDEKTLQLCLVAHDLGGAELANEQLVNIHAMKIRTPSGDGSRYTLKLDPQPQVDFTLGFPNLKPAPCSPST